MCIYCPSTFTPDDSSEESTPSGGWVHPDPAEQDSEGFAPMAWACRNCILERGEQWYSTDDNEWHDASELEQ